AAVSQKLGQAMYADAQGAQAAGGTQPGPEGGGTAGRDEDEVVDAEIVDEDDRARRGGSA
ncbi:hypothetical protein AB0A99_10885, partial [Streptomyces fradiae]